MDETKQEESLLNTFRELDKEDRYKLLNKKIVRFYWGERFKEPEKGKADEDYIL